MADLSTKASSSSSLENRRGALKWEWLLLFIDVWEDLKLAVTEPVRIWWNMYSTIWIWKSVFCYKKSGKTTANLGSVCLFGRLPINRQIKLSSICLFGKSNQFQFSFWNSERFLAFSNGYFELYFAGPLRSFGSDKYFN